MIPPDPEQLQVITNPDEIPQVETQGFYVSVRASYLGKTWELRMNSKATEATLSLVAKAEPSNSEVINVIRNIVGDLPPVDIVGLAGLAAEIQELIQKYSHKSFILEGEALHAE